MALQMILARNLNFLQVFNFNWSISQMKKTLLAMGVLGAFSSLAFAASNVTLYGLIEEGVVVSKAKHKDTIVDLKAGFDSSNRWLHP